LRDGWLHTGDLGSFDEHGFLTLAGRSKEVIISGGSNIYPREVEDVLLLHQAVTEAAVIGLPDPHWGEEVVAFVVCPAAGKVDVKELNELCLKNLARFKRPRRYFFVDRLPRNHYGKVLKSVLKDQTAPAPGLP
jgi:long-chain acyl-CoA synthetase